MSSIQKIDGTRDDWAYVYNPNMYYKYRPSLSFYGQMALVIRKDRNTPLLSCNVICVEVLISNALKLDFVTRQTSKYRRVM